MIGGAWQGRRNPEWSVNVSFRCSRGRWLGRVGGWRANRRLWMKAQRRKEWKCWLTWKRNWVCSERVKVEPESIGRSKGWSFRGARGIDYHQVNTQVKTVRIKGHKGVGDETARKVIGQEVQWTANTQALSVRQPAPYKACHIMMMMMMMFSSAEETTGTNGHGCLLRASHVVRLFHTQPCNSSNGVPLLTECIHFKRPNHDNQNKV